MLEFAPNTSVFFLDQEFVWSEIPGKAGFNRVDSVIIGKDQGLEIGLVIQVFPFAGGDD